MALCSSSIAAFSSHIRSTTTRSLVSRFSSATDEELELARVKEKRVNRNKAKEKRKQAARDKRKKFIGMAKAVDRGQFATTYSPRPFQALSGLPDRTQPFTVLGIESSCDDTGAAVIRSDGAILGEALASQQEIHEEWGGVVPGLARDAHEAKIDSVIQEALEAAEMSMDEIDAVGVTVGPGLEICLRVGAYKARDLAVQYQKPFVGVHHLEAHILMARIGEGAPVAATDETHESQRSMDFPFLALLVSGGHCQLMKCFGVGDYSIIGGTLDDSLGEAFDKTARMLGLPVGGGGGPAVERLAKEGNITAVKLPIPLQQRKDCDFSYAGLKTAVRMQADKIKVERGLNTTEELSNEDKANVAASFQHVAIKHIEQRLVRAMKICQDEDDITTLAVVGGVAANQELRSRLDAICSERDWTMHVPPPRLCTDQGAMSAWAAVERIMVGSTDVAHSQEVYARYPFAVDRTDDDTSHN